MRGGLLTLVLVAGIPAIHPYLTLLSFLAYRRIILLHLLEARQVRRLVQASGLWAEVLCVALRLEHLFTNVRLPSSAHWHGDHRHLVEMEFCQPGSLSDLSEQSLLPTCIGHVA